MAWWLFILKPAVVITVLVLAGTGPELRAREQTSYAITALLNLCSQNRQDDWMMMVMKRTLMPKEEMSKPGDTCIIRESVPVDGIVSKAKRPLMNRMVTEESMPVAKAGG